MSTSVGSIHYDLKLDTDNFDRTVDNTNRKLKTVGDKFDALGGKMVGLGAKMSLGLTLPIAAGAGFAIKAASDLNETINKVSVAFGDSANSVFEFGKTSIKSIGLAKSSALDAAALFGDMATSMGISQEAAASMSIDLVKLGGDLASFKNISFERAQIALAGVFTGETEALKGLGIVMSEVNLAAFAQSKGITKNYEDMTQAEKVNLRYQYVLDVTKNAQGDFTRTSEGTANQIRYTNERVKELNAEFGQRLLPFTGRLLELGNKLLDMFTNLSPKMQDIVLISLAVFAALGPGLVVMGSLVTVVGSLIPLLANPVFWVIAAVLGVLAGAIYLVKINWDSVKPVLENIYNIFDTKVKPAIENVTNKLKDLWSWIQVYILPIFRVIWAFVTNQLRSAFEDLKNAFNRVKEAVEPFMPQLKMLAQIFGIVALVIAGIVIGTIFAFITAFTIAIGVISRVIGWISELISWMFSLASSTWHALNNVKNTIFGVFSGAWNWLYDAGRSIIDGLINGIRDNIGGAVSAAKDVVSKVRNLFPFSPAKEGPFSGKGWTLYSGQSIMQGLADGINKAGNIPQMAMDKALSGINTDLSLSSKPIISAGQTATSNNNASPQNNITINLDGVMSESREGTRQVARTLVNALNEQLRAQNKMEIGI